MGSDRVPRASPAPSGVNVVCSPNKSSKEGSGGGRVGGGSGREGQVLLLHLLRGFPLGGVSCYLLSLIPGHGGNGGGVAVHRPSPWSHSYSCLSLLPGSPCARHRASGKLGAYSPQRHGQGECLEIQAKVIHKTLVLKAFPRFCSSGL